MQYNVLLIILSLYSFLQINLLLLIYQSQPISPNFFNTINPYYCQISNTIKIKNALSLRPLFASILLNNSLSFSFSLSPTTRSSLLWCSTFACLFLAYLLSLLKDLFLLHWTFSAFTHGSNWMSFLSPTCLPGQTNCMRSWTPLLPLTQSLRSPRNTSYRIYSAFLRFAPW